MLDRTPEEAVDTVSSHLARMLASRGLKDSPLFVVREGEVSEEGLLPAAARRDIRGWLESLAADAEARSAVVGRPSTGPSAAWPGSHARGRRRRRRAGRRPRVRLREDADAAYDQAIEAVATASADGTLLRGEVLARWQEFVGTGELLRSLETRIGLVARPDRERDQGPSRTRRSG